MSYMFQVSRTEKGKKIHIFIKIYIDTRNFPYFSEIPLKYIIETSCEIEFTLKIYIIFCKKEGECKKGIFSH